MMLMQFRDGSEGERKAENPKPSSLELNKTMNILPFTFPFKFAIYFVIHAGV